MRYKIADTDILLAVVSQNDFCPGGKFAVPYGDEVVLPVNLLGKRVQHVVPTQGGHLSGHRSFTSTYPGRQPFDTVALTYGWQVLWPDHCVQDTPGARERGHKRVFLAGLALDFCVRFSAEDAYRCGFEVVVAEDACRSIDVGGSLEAARRAFAQLAIPRAAVEAIA
jgi:nicotinamidase/pyrazinamidase